MSNVWEIRCRVLLEGLEILADQLKNEKSIAPAALEEQTVRLLTSVIILLRQHQISKWGQCKYCEWSWRFWHRRPLRTVYWCVDFAMRQPLDVVRGWMYEE